jgi:hypothetical protein
MAKCVYRPEELGGRCCRAAATTAPSTASTRWNSAGCAIQAEPSTRASGRPRARPENGLRREAAADVRGRRLPPRGPRVPSEALPRRGRHPAKRPRRAVALALNSLRRLLLRDADHLLGPAGNRVGSRGRKRPARVGAAEGSGRRTGVPEGEVNRRAHAVDANDERDARCAPDAVAAGVRPPVRRRRGAAQDPQRGGRPEPPADCKALPPTRRDDQVDGGHAVPNEQSGLHPVPKPPRLAADPQHYALAGEGDSLTNDLLVRPRRRLRIDLDRGVAGQGLP